MSRRSTVVAAFIAVCMTLLGLLGVARTSLRGGSNIQVSSSQPAAQDTDDMAGMPNMNPSTGGETRDPRAQQGAMESMSHEHMEMGAHMRMSDSRPETPEDAKRAEEVLEALRPAIEKYKDYHIAVQDGYRPFLPNLKQRVYHFTNYWYAFKARFAFNPAEPTSLLYKKTAGRYQLVGAMYTAPRKFSEDKLNQRVPLSVARWHQHVNICLPQKGKGKTADWREFGFAGSIATQEACDAAGGRWYPIIFGWMVHVYPFENDPAKIWAH